MSDTPPSPTRHRLSLSIRGLMVVVLVLAGVMGWLVYKARVQHEVVATLGAAGRAAYYDWERSWVDGHERLRSHDSPTWPKWLIKAFGPDHFGTIVAVDLNPMGDLPRKDVHTMLTHVSRLDRVETLLLPRGGLSAESLRLIGGMTHLKKLSMYGVWLSPPGLAELTRLSRLEDLDLSLVDLSPSDVAALAKFTSLKRLEIDGESITDDSLKSLENLTRLERLGISYAPITSAGLVHLRHLKLKGLSLHATNVTDLKPIGPMSTLRDLSLSGRFGDDCIASLTAFPNLEDLALMSHEFTDAGLKPLEALAKLGRLQLLCPGDSPKALASLRTKLPNLSINGDPTLNDSSPGTNPTGGASP